MARHHDVEYTAIIEYRERQCVGAGYDDECEGWFRERENCWLVDDTGARCACILAAADMSNDVFRLAGSRHSTLR